MPKRLKRAIGRLAGKRKKPPTQASPSDGQDDKLDQGYRPSFLGLPPEIRNQIYEDVASETTLSLRPTKSRKPLTPLGMLLACHQTRREFKKMLLANAQILISISEYHFCNLVRVLETLCKEDLEVLKLNSNIWVLIHISHVPSRDDRKNLAGWIDYRGMDHTTPYFGPNAKLGEGLVFEYDVRFSQFLRPPRPMSRYTNGYQMKLDLLRTHLRLYQRLENELYDERPSNELKKLRKDIEECVHMFEELQVQRLEPPSRSDSVITTATQALTISDATPDTIDSG